MPASIEIPPTLRELAARDSRLAAFVDGLPALVREVVEEWRLELDGAPRHGQAALVVPVRTSAGRPAVLKLALPHDEAEHEDLALQHWHGRGRRPAARRRPAPVGAAARAAARRRGPRPSCGTLEACEVVAGLYARLHVPALPQLRRLSSYVDRWTERLRGAAAGRPGPAATGRAGGVAGPGPRRRRRDGRPDDPRRPALRERAGRRTASPGWSSTPSRWPATRTTSRRRCSGTGGTRWSPRARPGRRAPPVPHARRRRRARRGPGPRLGGGPELHNALWALEDAARRTALDADDRAYLTTCIAIAKAVQD